MSQPEAAPPAELQSSAANKARDAGERGVAPTETADNQLKPAFFSPDGPPARFLYWSLFALGSILQGLLFRLRVTGANVVPLSGPFLLVANHQSFLDPPMLGQATRRRRLHYLAMSGLFKFAPFGWLIKALGAIPIERTGNAGPGLKASLKCLKEGHGLVLFPEGSRTPNAQLQPFKRGVGLLLRRARAPVVVAGIAGAFDAWPIFKKFPIPRPIWIHLTTWKWPDGAEEPEALDDLRRTVQGAMDVAERGWRRLGGKPKQTRAHRREEFGD